MEHEWLYGKLTADAAPLGTVKNKGHVGPIVCEINMSMYTFAVMVHPEGEVGLAYKDGIKRQTAASR